MNLSVVIIALNEERNIRDCLRSVSWADERIVVDGGSSDFTAKFAEEEGATVYKIPFRDFASQKNAAIELAVGRWVLVLDADERPSAETAEEIRRIAEAKEEDAVYAIHRDTYFFGKRLRFSGTRSDYPVRLFPKGSVKFVQPVHETIQTALPVRRLKSSLVHYTTRNLNQYKQKLRQYTSFELSVMREKKKDVKPWTPWSVSILRFFYIYFIQAGVLDGATGLKYAVLSAYYDFVKYRLYLRK